MPPKEAVKKYTLHRAAQGFFKTRFQAAYKAVKEEQDVDVSAQSIINFRQLYQNLKNMTNVPENEKAYYGEKLLNDAEQALLTTWRSLDKTLKHATRRIDFDVLKPLNKRAEEKGVIHNAHTGSFRSHRAFSYFSPGIGDEYTTPGFISDNADTIVVNLSQLQSYDRKDIFGLWISNDIYYYPQQAEFFDTYGTTRRYVFYHKNFEKTYRYVRENGQILERTVHYRDEIYSADRNINTIFDALFFQFIIELRMIGGTFQQQIYTHASDPKMLAQVFHLVFPSRIYPEAKLPLNLDLKKPYAKKISTSHERVTIKGKWFEAIRDGNIPMLKRCLDLANKSGIRIIHARTPMNESGLMTVFHCDDHALRTATLDFLLEQGEQVYHEDPLVRTVFHRAIDKRDLHNFERLLKVVDRAFVDHEAMALKIFTYCFEYSSSDFVKYFLEFFQSKKFLFLLPNQSLLSPIITSIEIKNSCLMC